MTDKARFMREGDLRKEVREAFANTQWVEAALGGSTGLPDCFINDDQGMVSRVGFFELKVGEYYRDGVGRVMKDSYRGRGGDWLKYEMRPEQRKRIKAMQKAGYSVWLLVGEKWGHGLWRIRPDEETLHGWCEVSRARDTDKAVRILDLRAELMAGIF